MNLIGNVRAMVALGCCIGASGALAGDIVLFENPNFQGYSVTYNGDVENLGGTGFNDRTSSISIRQGLWEVCVDAYYEGGCLQLAPGLYPQLNPPFNRSISSLREVGGDYAPPVTPVPPAPPYIELFDREYFQGSVMVFQNAADNLGNTGFNDQTSSISVRSGTWEVCYDAYYQGGCMQLPPGDYPRLDQPFVRSISSLRPIGDGGWVQAGGYAGGNTVVDVSSAPAYGASVAITGANIGVTVASYPELVAVPGYPVYYAPGLNANYFFYDGLFWVYQRDNWYSSTWYNGPWGLVAPNVVPLYVLRVPVSYYRRPPPYFHGWRGDAPPRWGDHWGPSWSQARYGWDRWDRHAVPPPAPLPVYQRPFAGDRYPRPDQQQTLLRENYRYQPKDGYAQQQFHRPPQPGPGVQPPRPTGQPPSTQPGGPTVQPPRPPGQPGQPGQPPSTQPPRPPGQPGQPGQPPSTQPPRPPGQPGQPGQPPSTQPPRPAGQPGQPGQPPSTQPPRPTGQPGQPPSPTMQPGASPSQAPQQPARQPRPSSPPAGTQQFAPSGGMPQSPGLPPQGGGGRPPSAQPAPQGGPAPVHQSGPTQRPQGQQPSGQTPQQSGGGRRGPSDGQGQGQGQSQGGDGGGGPPPRGGR